MSKLEVPVKVQGLTYHAKLDTGDGTSSITRKLWHKLGSPPLQDTRMQYASASQHKMPDLGEFVEHVSSPMAE